MLVQNLVCSANNSVTLASRSLVLLWHAAPRLACLPRGGYQSSSQCKKLTKLRKARRRRHLRIGLVSELLRSTQFGQTQLRVAGASEQDCWASDSLEIKSSVIQVDSDWTSSRIDLILFISPTFWWSAQIQLKFSRNVCQSHTISAVRREIEICQNLSNWIADVPRGWLTPSGNEDEIARTEERSLSPSQQVPLYCNNRSATEVNYIWS